MYDRVHDSIMMWLKNPAEKKLYFHRGTSLNSRDSFTVIGAEYGGYMSEYAIINENKNSTGHSFFSKGSIQQWKEDRMDEYAVRANIVPDSIQKVREVDRILWERMKGYWVPVCNIGWGLNI